MKPLNLYAEKHGQKIEKRQAWGTYRGFPFTVGNYSNDNILTVVTALRIFDPEREQKLYSRLEGMKAAKEFLDFKGEQGALIFRKAKPFGKVSSAEIEGLLDHLTDAFTEADAKPACFYCHSEGTAEYASYNGMNLPMCENCYTSISSHVSQSSDEYAKKEANYGAGLFGALIGALVGSIAWVVIGVLGFVAAIAGLAISAAATKGYTMLGGKITKASLWIIGIASVFALTAAQFILYTILLFREADAYGTTISYIDSFTTIIWMTLNDAQFMLQFFKDYALGLLFAGLGAYSTFRRLLLTAKAPAGELKRM